MTDKDEDILADLLIRWDELREEGRDVAALELCQSYPHLADELSRRIHAMQVTSWLDKPVDVPVSKVEGKNSENHQSRTLIGRYRLDNLIAEGGFAQVWRAYDLELHRLVAVKVPKPSRLDSADAFMAEARRVARLKHPGIVPVHDIGREDGACFIVSEFVEGGNLANQIAKSPISPEQAVRWTAEIAEALEYAHANGVIHRDIKPANILIDHHGRALLADFGIAQSATKTGRFAPSIGTLRYMAPEQLEGKAVDARSDIYSLGVVFHELLTGELPYSSDEPNVLRQEIVSGAKIGPNNLPIELRRICLKALERDPSARYSTADKLASDLRTSLVKTSTRWTIFGIVALAFISIFVGLAIWTQKKERGHDQATNSKTPVDNKQLEMKPATVEEALAMGKKNFDQNQYGRAVQNYTQAIALDPNNAEAYDKRGACRFNSGEFKESLPDFNKAIELDPKNAEFCKHRAFSFLSLRQFDPAIADMEQALILNPPEPAPFRETLANIYSNRAADRSHAEMFAEAAADVTLAIKYFPQGQNFYHQRGSCYFNNKEYEKAADDFSEAIKQEPTKGAHYLHRGYCLSALGKNDEAATDFEKAKMLGESQ